MRAIYTAKQIKKWDDFTIQTEPISSHELMQRAAARATKYILANHTFESVAIICGPGNNGGDGLVIAKLLFESQRKVNLYIISATVYSSDFKYQLKQLPEGLQPKTIDSLQVDQLATSDLLIDCIFGTGLSREVTGKFADIIQAINHCESPTIAIDIPSGLFAETNNSNEGAIIEAAQTLSFMQFKRSFLFAKNEQYCGTIKIINIDLHQNFKEDCDWMMLESNDIQFLPKKTFAHKGSHGKALIVGGIEGMNGAAILASKAAIHSGAGYVFCASEQATADALLVAQPEVINLPMDDLGEQQVDAIGIGVGMGTNKNSKLLLEKAFKSAKPLVLDADAINLLAQHPELQQSIPEHSILTPHPKELKRLIGEFEEFELLEKQVEYSKKQAVYILQKGKFSKITTPDGRVIVNPTGNSAMATAGMGDVLTGIITSLLAQGYTTEKALGFACYIHGKSADELVYASNHYTLTASQVIQQLSISFTKFVR